MKIVVRAPVKPVWHHEHTQVGDTSLATPVALDSDLILQPFERTVVKAKLITDTLEPLIFQSVALNAAIADASLHNVVFRGQRRHCQRVRLGVRQPDEANKQPSTSAEGNTTGPCTTGLLGLPGHPSANARQPQN